MNPEKGALQSGGKGAVAQDALIRLPKRPSGRSSSQSSGTSSGTENVAGEGAREVLGTWVSHG